MVLAMEYVNSLYTDHEYNISDVFFTWGWKDNKKKKKIGVNRIFFQERKLLIKFYLYIGLIKDFQ